MKSAHFLGIYVGGGRGADGGSGVALIGCFFQFKPVQRGPVVAFGIVAAG